MPSSKSQAHEAGVVEQTLLPRRRCVREKTVTEKCNSTGIAHDSSSTKRMSLRGGRDDEATMKAARKNNLRRQEKCNAHLKISMKNPPRENAMRTHAEKVRGPMSLLQNSRELSIY
ncbi:hypothetical protein [Herbaspirillum sp. CF444]|uniref:hypothetical protein n=1 Tax=Herbaspirillum sp. CF444 TaxID=1144319 RepID=UPI001ED975EF|nr:hypothetical protein [Herbaspirillum sp. CF444]